MANPDLFSLRSEVFRDSSGSSGSSRVGDSTCAREAHHIQPAPIDDVMILLKKFSSSMDTAVRKVGILGHTAHLMEEALLQTVLAPLRSGEGQQGGSDDNDDDIPRKPDQSGAKLPYIQRLETLLAMTARDTEGTSMSVCLNSVCPHVCLFVRLYSPIVFLILRFTITPQATCFF